jgi:hypothetical protein
MKKLGIFGLIVVVVGVLDLWLVASALAVEPGWFLANGMLFEGVRSATTEGELLFENLKTANATFLCSVILEGDVVNEAAGGLSEVTKMLELSFATEAIESDSVAKITCTPDPNSICLKPAVSPINLPWIYDLELVSETDYQLETLANTNGKLPGYFILCEVIGLDATELCEMLAGTTQLVENGVNDVVFPAGTSPTPDAHCSSDGATEESGGLVVDEALLFLNTGEPLAASE